MTLQDTYCIEIANWDSLALKDRPDPSLMLDDPDFEAHARRVRTLTRVSEFLRDLRGREVLEMGWGLGVLTTLLARSGARVHAFDLCPASVDVARRRADLHGVGDAVPVTVAAAEEVPCGADEPLSYEAVRARGAPFREFEHREIELLSMVRRAFGIRRPLPRLASLDDRLLDRWPALGRFCRSVVLTMVK
jgi:SAM-dependent methyltransferase